MLKLLTDSWSYITDSWHNGHLKDWVYSAGVGLAAEKTSKPWVQEIADQISPVSITSHLFQIVWGCIMVIIIHLLHLALQKWLPAKRSHVDKSIEEVVTEQDNDK
jgi:hypothetical protein